MHFVDMGHLNILVTCDFKRIFISEIVLWILLQLALDWHRTATLVIFLSCLFVV